MRANLPVTSRRRTRCWIIGSLAAVALISVFYHFWRSEFRRVLPVSAQSVQEKEIKWNWDYEFYGKARISETDFRRFSKKLQLEPYKPTMEMAAHYAVPTHPDELGLMPDWFVPTPTLANAYVRLKFPYFTGAKYENGHVYFYRRYCNWDL